MPEPDLKDWTVEQAQKFVDDHLPKPETPTFIPTRYPYTYAYDFYRGHHRRDGAVLLSRADVAGLIKGNSHKERIVRIWADAYLEQEGHVRPEGGWEPTNEQVGTTAHG